MPEEQPDADVLDLAARIFDLAREGTTEQLGEYVDAGVPVDLTNAKGDSREAFAPTMGPG